LKKWTLSFFSISSSVWFLPLPFTLFSGFSEKIFPPKNSAIIKQGAIKIAGVPNRELIF